MTPDLINYQLRRRAEQFTHHVPWMYEQVLYMLGEHQQEWEKHVQDMDQVARSPMDNDQVSRIGQRYVSQILASGELLHKRIQAVIANAIVTQEGKPISTQWSPEQTQVGHHKRQLLSTALTFTHGL